MREYFPCYHSYLRKIAKLSDQEIGRLFRALLTYSATGERQELPGREAVAYDFIADDIDRANEAYQEKCEINRRNRTSTTVNDRQRPSTTGDETHQNKDKDKYKDKDKINIECGATSAPTRARFVPPTVDDVRAYCTEQGYRIDPERFVAYYESNGWKVGRNSMRDWRAACRTWARGNSTGSKPNAPTPTALQFDQRDYTGVDLSSLNVDLEKYRGGT